ncbi:MAG: ABC transporter substrate-binding protein [Chitinispirillales bacterium]|nr:ABC transporter substrate-binding protein [Chitinispirillales bacterium]
MKRFLRSLKLLAASAALAGFAVMSCGDGAGFPRNETLYLGGSQWGDPSTFNPLVEAWVPSWPIKDRFNLVYEPLIAYNTLNGEYEPLLGTLHSIGTEKIVVDINPKARWSDGTRVTSEDVKFVFLLGRRFSNAATVGILQSVSDILVEVLDDAEGTERLSFMVNKTLPPAAPGSVDAVEGEDAAGNGAEEASDVIVGRNNPLLILDALLATRIPPAHVFERLLAENNNDLEVVKRLRMDDNPVVSGPYNLEHYNNERIVLKRRDDYWGNDALYGGKLPAPKYIIHPVFKDNNHFATSLQRGRLDASQTFIPRIWYRKRDNVHTWLDEAPYFVPGTIWFFLINNTKAPLNDVNFRRAMAAAINYTDIKELAVSRYTPEMQPGAIMNHGLEARFFNAEDVERYGVRHDPEEAKRILAEAGYQSIFRSDGTLDHMLDRDGNRLPPLSMMHPAGWSDFEAVVVLVEKSLRAVGIDVRGGPVDDGVYWSSRPAGSFDLMITKIAENITPSLPWSRFEALMSSRNWRPIGGATPMHENYGRYNDPSSPTFNPRVDELLAAVPTMTDDAEIVAAYHELNRIFMQDQPAIPLVSMPEQFYQFSDKNWRNWPTAANPYAPPLLPWVGASTKILWHLEPAR